MKMKKYLTLLKGKKTYIATAVTFIAGGLSALGYPVPEELVILLAGAGMYLVKRTHPVTVPAVEEAYDPFANNIPAVELPVSRPSKLVKPTIAQLKALGK